MDGARIVTKKDIIDGLRRLGIAPGDCLLVHGSLESFGRVEGGANAVIDALLDAVGTGGTVMAPTFDCPDPVFDPKRSGTPLGAIPSALWMRTGAQQAPPGLRGRDRREGRAAHPGA